VFDELSQAIGEAAAWARLGPKFSAKAQALAISEEQLSTLIRCPIDSAPIGLTPPHADALDELKAEEFAALSDPAQCASGNFEGTSYSPPLDGGSPAFNAIVMSVSLITRMREVRAVRGFHRQFPGALDRLVSVAEREQTDWLPACEVFGEGMFLRFNPTHLARWKAALSAREQQRFGRMERSIQERRISFLPSPTPEFVAMHGFAHALIRQLTFDCGYAASSLRERIYSDVDRTQLGILIYTADGDSEGTLGGLVRQGTPSRLLSTVARALQSCSWCSSDPLCYESENQGLGGFNRAACHSCLLVSETSCECANTLLDRRLLLGRSPGAPGLFDDLAVELGVS